MNLSELVFFTPSQLPGLDWDSKKIPVFSTGIQESSSGLERRASYQAYPRWKFALSLEFLTDDGTATGDLQKVAGFFLARRGSFDDFLYQDPDECTVTNQSFGLGDGTTTQFQLLKSFGGFLEPVKGIKETPTIYVNGTTTTPASITTKGLVTFSSAPASGALLTWTGNFYYRVRFTNDESEFSLFANKLWELKKVEFKSVK